MKIPRWYSCTNFGLKLLRMNASGLKINFRIVGVYVISQNWVKIWCFSGKVSTFVVLEQTFLKKWKKTKSS